jgi:hypothetical protein
MSRAIAWTIRAASFVLVGVLTFLVQPPGATAMTAQFIGYVVVGLGLLAWALIDWYPKASWYRGRALPVIHGVLAHSLGALSIQIQAARAVLTDHHDLDRAVDILATAQRMAADGLTETRRAVHALRMDSKPLNEELGRVTGIHCERYDIKVTLGIGGAPRPVPPDATLALLRTAQEALVNAAKHAAGQGVAVHLDYGAATTSADPADAAERGVEFRYENFQRVSYRRNAGKINPAGG